MRQGKERGWMKTVKDKHDTKEGIGKTQIKEIVKRYKRAKKKSDNYETYTLK